MQVTQRDLTRYLTSVRPYSPLPTATSWISNIRNIDNRQVTRSGRGQGQGRALNINENLYYSPEGLNLGLVRCLCPWFLRYIFKISHREINFL